MVKTLFKLGLVFSIAFMVLLFASLYDIRLNEVGHNFRHSMRGFVNSGPVLAFRESTPVVRTKKWVDARLDRMPWARKLPSKIQKEIPEIDRAWVDDRKREVEDRIRGKRVRKLDAPASGSTYLETASRLREERRRDENRVRAPADEMISEKERRELEELLPSH